MNAKPKIMFSRAGISHTPIFWIDCVFIRGIGNQVNKAILLMCRSILNCCKIVHSDCHQGKFYEYIKGVAFNDNLLAISLGQIQNEIVANGNAWHLCAGKTNMTFYCIAWIQQPFKCYMSKMDDRVINDFLPNNNQGDYLYFLQMAFLFRDST